MATRTTSEPTIGELVAKATAEMSALVRDEIALAKAELSGELGKAGKGVGMVGAASVVGYVGLLFLSLALMFGLAEVLPTWAAALAVGLVYTLGAVGLVLSGKATLGSMSPVPRRTIQTLKEDAEWARHPTS